MLALKACTTVPYHFYVMLCYVMLCYVMLCYVQVQRMNQNNDGTNGVILAMACCAPGASHSVLGHWHPMHKMAACPPLLLLSTHSEKTSRSVTLRTVRRHYSEEPNCRD